ncbi:exosome complex protein Rrp42 [Candidatus Nanohalococcus occultus]|uniref:Exosome complex RNA-binding protein Rrp42, RNasePH superfamily n=1 Tax=Candidatus Nanohalococcus occultus TaxID=2978047 RepID=A0ABY8CE48_9ARCH|nr:Exosome complex RNA-binding protein Rrp42, RNasePH superfamily [Candidatus Nanohaloarchaeota archaeon SVXNc]
MKLNQDTIRKMAKDQERLDGRDLKEFREIEVETDYIHETAEGSAKVSIGKTQVVVGIKIGVESPYSDRPDEGTIVTNAELAPMAAREYESGPPQEEGVELARVVDRGIRESEAVDLEELCIEPGEKVMTVFIDVHVLNDDGNLIDASSLGAMAALKTGYIPVYDEEEDTLVRGEKDRDIPIDTEPVTVTGHKIGEEIFWDVTGEEEDARDARLTVSINEKGNVVAMQKGETEPFSQDEINQIIEEAESQTQDLREILDNAAEE